MAAPNTDSFIDMLSGAAATAESSEAQEGFVTLIGILVALLDLLIGERLTFRILSEVWPELPMSQSAQSTRRNGTGKLEVNY